MNSGSRIDVVTFGCRLNLVESEAMRRLAIAGGHHDLTIVNTCAVTAEASRQARQAIRRIRRERPDGSLAVTGCAAETEGAAFGAMPEIDRIVPNAIKTDAIAWGARSGLDDATLKSPCSDQAGSGPHTRAFVEVQNGCDHRCTFCVIPFGRGASRSQSAETLIARIRDHVARGALEVVLTGVDVTSYGGDLAGRPTLGRLVRRILAAVPDLPRLRLSSLDCIEADPDLLAALADEPRLMPHLHLSIQSGSDLILKRMKRRHDRRDIMAFCDTVRALRPETVFGADFIAGFPTETDAMFEETLDLVKRCGITYLHAFPYSARPGTPAARMPAVSPDVVKDRAARLRACGTERLARHLAAQRGRHVTVATERGGKGHAEDFTTVRLPPDTPPGRLARVFVTGHDGRMLSSVAA